MTVGTSDVFALTALFDAVTTRFADESTPVEMGFGWREPDKQRTAQYRIAWVPGDSAGALGEMLAPRQIGGNPRNLADLGELFHCVLTGSDLSAPEDERAQYVATRRLYDVWWRAVYLAVRGNLSVTSATWLGPPKVRRAGATIVATCTLRSPIPDTVYDLVSTPATAALEVAELDITDTVEITP